LQSEARSVTNKGEMDIQGWNTSNRLITDIALLEDFPISTGCHTDKECPQEFFQRRKNILGGAKFETDGTRTNVGAEINNRTTKVTIF